MTKIVLGLLVVILIFVLGGVIFNRTYPFHAKITYGVTFSPKFAQYLNLDWQKTYLGVLNDLKVKNLRIPSYWDVLEPQEGRYDFSRTDFMLNEASKSGAQVILVLGARQPRWPECQIPAWAKSLKTKQRQGKTLQFIRKTIDRYKDNPAVWAWQVENEPLLPFFGEGCSFPDVNFLKTEVSLVRSLTSKYIIVSDSGELGAWIVPMQLSDIFGTTLYRDVYNPVMGYFSYPISPFLYNIKSQVARIFAPSNQKTVIIELQAEPWFSDGGVSQNFARQVKQFPLEKMKSYLNYAQQTGFDTMYFWGVEWWYFMAENGYPQYLDYARMLFR